MRVLITGGSGFIGSRLVEELLKGKHEVIIYDKVMSKKYPDLTLIGDVRNKAELERSCNQIDIVYHLAAEHADDVRPKSLYDEVNVGGAINLVNACENQGVHRIVFTSSVAIYGLNRGTPNESTDPQPFNDYGRTKFEAENIFIKWAKKSDLKSLTILRPSVVFGEKNRGNVYNLINQITSGKFIMVGNGLNKKSMTYVGNITAFLDFTMKSKNGISIYNFADKPDLNSNEIVDLTTSIMGMKNKTRSLPYSLGLLAGYSFDILAFVTRKKFPISSIRIKKFCAETTVNTDKLINSGFHPPFSIEDGLRLMILAEFKKR